MFHKEIVELQRIRKNIDKVSIDMSEDNWLSYCLSDVSYSITIAIQDLIRVSKILKNRENE